MVSGHHAVNVCLMVSTEPHVRLPAGLFAKLSMTELRARQGVCSGTCNTYHCYKVQQHTKPQPRGMTRNPAAAPALPMLSTAPSSNAAACAVTQVWVGMFDFKAGAAVSAAAALPAAESNVQFSSSDGMLGGVLSGRCSAAAMLYVALCRVGQLRVKARRLEAAQCTVTLHR